MLLVHKKPMAHGSDSCYIDVSVDCGNTVKISGETWLYSDHEGCTSHVSFKGWIILTIGEGGKVTSFIDPGIVVEAEYDGWSEEELDSYILTQLQEQYTFETV